MLRKTLVFLKDVKIASNIKVGRHFDDFFTSRIVQACTESTLLSAMERLLKLVNADNSKIFKANINGMIEAASSSEAYSILNWMRNFPRVASMVTSIKTKEEFEAAIDLINESMERIEDDVDVLHPYSANFDVNIKAECLSPLSHGADGKAGNATLFRRRQVITEKGRTLTLPFYAGNAIRGQIRDLLADHFLSSLGYIPRKDTPPCNLWFFHALYAGGVLEEASKVTENIEKELGKHGSVRTDGLRRMRDMIPPISLLGSALGNKIVPGRIAVADLRPVCKEWGFLESANAAQLTDWEYLTRRDDHEGRTSEDQHNGMIAMSEVLRTGTCLVGGIDIDTHASDIDKACLGMGLKLLKEKGKLGAENRRGFGNIAFEIENIPDARPYEEFLEKNRDEIRKYLFEIDAVNLNTTFGGEIASGQLDCFGGIDKF